MKGSNHLEDLIKEMLKNDSNEAKKELLLKNEGFELTKSIETISDRIN